MRMPKLLPDVPPAAAWLTLAGIVPFAAAALGSFLSGPLGPFAASALLAYGAVILSFLGGLHWGLAIARAEPSFARLGLGVVPSLVGWTALLLGGRPGLLLLALAFLLVFLLDRRLTRNGMAPPWFMKLRLPPTAAAVLCLLAAAVA